MFYCWTVCPFLSQNLVLESFSILGKTQQVQVTNVWGKLRYLRGGAGCHGDGRKHLQTSDPDAKGPRPTLEVPRVELPHLGLQNLDLQAELLPLQQQVPSLQLQQL